MRQQGSHLTGLELLEAGCTRFPSPAMAPQLTQPVEYRKRSSRVRASSTPKKSLRFPTLNLTGAAMSVVPGLASTWYRAVFVKLTGA